MKYEDEMKWNKIKLTTTKIHNRIIPELLTILITTN